MHVGCIVVGRALFVFAGWMIACLKPELKPKWMIACPKPELGMRSSQVMELEAELGCAV